MTGKFLMAAAACFAAFALSAEPLEVKSGDKIAFMGDSITDQGNRHSAGYVNMVITGLEANGIKAIKLPSGVDANNSVRMLGRVDRDIIQKAPQFLLLSCGVNDVDGQFKPGSRTGVPLDEYKKNITQIVEKAQAAGIKVIIMTATIIGEEKPHSEKNKMLATYNEFLRKLAAEKKCRLCDLNKIMYAQIEIMRKYAPKRYWLLTRDGVHMAVPGYKMMALAILRTFGLNEEQIAKAEAAINRMRTSMEVYMTVGEWEKIERNSGNKRPGEYAHDLMNLEKLPVK